MQPGANMPISAPIANLFTEPALFLIGLFFLVALLSQF